MKKKIFYPKNYGLLIGLLIIVISLIYLIFFNGFGSPLAYVLYLVMSYFLVVICIKLYIIFKNRINRFIDSSRYLSKYRDDYRVKYRISLFISLLFNIIYVLFRLTSGIMFSSIWFIITSIYYVLLIILRINIVKLEFKDNINLKDEYLKYRKTAVILLFMNVILIMVILVIVNQKIMNVYLSSIAIAVAVYTFYVIFISIYNLIKYKKYKSPLMSALKVINVITSLVSLISLEIVLIPTFGVNNTSFYEIMLMATGGGIAIIIMIISLYMIIKATEWLREN